MASRGSVIPLFIEQIKSRNPLTITDPNMTRFMMTLEDAVDLVLFAFANGEQGDIFVQKSPATTIKILAEALLELYNATNEIKVIGVRHCEKIYETFGKTVVEAFACGCPVIASNTGSTPEIVNDAGVLFNPYNYKELTNAMHRIILDKKYKI